MLSLPDSLPDSDSEIDLPLVDRRQERPDITRWPK